MVEVGGPFASPPLQKLECPFRINRSSYFGQKCKDVLQSLPETVLFDENQLDRRGRPSADGNGAAAGTEIMENVRSAFQR